MDESAPQAPRQKTPLRKADKETDTLYFAYGSNIHVAQMAQRCPDSIFKGTATLPGYRWQINQRGVANVLEPAPDFSVEGLVYLVNAKDEKSLDRSEGVAKGFYQKHILKVEMQAHEKYAEFKSAHLSQLLAQQDISAISPASDSSGTNQAKSEPSGSVAQQIEALVYVSEGYTIDGTIREEYIGRMQKAVSDAIALGISRSFLDKYIVPHLRSDNEQHQPKKARAAKKASANAVQSSAKTSDLDEGKGKLGVVLIIACLVIVTSYYRLSSKR